MKYCIKWLTIHSWFQKHKGNMKCRHKLLAKIKFNHHTHIRHQNYNTQNKITIHVMVNRNHTAA